MDLYGLLHFKRSTKNFHNKFSTLIDEKMLHNKVKASSIQNLLQCCEQGGAKVDRDNVAFDLVKIVFSLLNISCEDYPILSKVMAAFLQQKTENLSLIYFTKAKALLPDTIETLIGTVYSIDDFLSEMTQDFRKLYVISSLMSACLIGKNATVLRIRCVPKHYNFKNIKPRDVTLDTDMYDYDTWEEESPYLSNNFFDVISDREEICTERLLSNGVFTKMDVASCIHNKKRESIDITGLRDVQAFNHFQRSWEVDWRFVGMATMYHQNEDEERKPLKIRLSLVEHLEDWEDQGGVLKPLKNIKYMKMLQELNFCSAATTKLVLQGFTLKIGTVLSLFNSLESLEMIKADETHLAPLHVRN